MYKLPVIYVTWTQTLNQVGCIYNFSTTLEILLYKVCCTVYHVWIISHIFVSKLLTMPEDITGKHCLIIIDIIIIKERKIEYNKKKTFSLKHILVLMAWTKVISVSDNNKTMLVSCYQSSVLVSSEQWLVWQLDTLTSSWSQNCIHACWGQLWVMF